ncbi:Extracellular solute-binding protein, family 5 precursor [Bosea sp. LC85]|uniref:extracellular solute-binding protein n=1 Tax=Bosea sp. LC85 TaxID=1502851 RepID=UPI0004E2B2E8|nr:extracellular solute-binding protein [Bosea sp. LC85]KFC70307.1 Extracellular solute-binding protein, family 5 precursor [Bosea sp. LC85]
MGSYLAPAAAIGVAVRHIFAVLAVVLVAGAVARAESSSADHAIAMHGEPALAKGFAHLPYADPAAPRGGRIIFGLQGTFDSLNPLVVLGVAPDAVPRYVQQSLLFRSADEPFTAYGLLASEVELNDDRTRLAFEIDPRATFSDGQPVTAEDVRFTFEMLRTKGKPFHRSSLGRVTRVEVPSPRRIEFELGDGSNRELPLVIGAMPIFAKHATNAETFGETSFKPALGSGPYLVSEVKPGEALTLKRRSGFWAEDHPLTRGLFNADEIRYDFYRDANTLFEAFKAGLYDVRLEGDPTRWMTGYDVPAVRDGRIIREALRFEAPKGMTGFVFNTRRAVFADVRVREALGILFDFEWANRNLFHGAFRRAGSFFADSDLSALGVAADAREQALLASFPGAVREDVLAGTWTPSATDGSGRDRDQARKALDLLQGAGYALQDGVLRNSKSGEALTFEITVTSRPQERLALNYAKSLTRLGIAVTVRLIDDVQYWRRLSAFDFDMIQWTWPASASPGNEQVGRWDSSNAERKGSLNYAGVKSPAVDAVLKTLLSARERADFVASVRTLDRLLISGFYVVPLYYLPETWLARSRDVVLPARRPAYFLSTEVLARVPAPPAPAN